MKKLETITTYAYKPKYGDMELMFSNGTLGPTFEDEQFQIIGTQQVEVEYPDSYEWEKKAVVILQAKKTSLMAEFQARITEIDRQIQEHLALPMNTPEGGTHGF